MGRDTTGGMGRVVVVLIFALGVLGAAYAKPRAVDVAVVADGPSSLNDRVFALFEREILALTGGEFEVRFPAAKRAAADWTGPGVRAALDAALADPEVDLVLTLGILGSHAAGHTDHLTKPVVAPFVIDAQLQQFPEGGRKNLAFLSGRLDFGREVQVFREVVRYEHLVCLGNRHFLEAVPQLAVGVGAVLAAQQTKVDLVMVGDDLDAALRSIPKGADAVYVAPMLHLSDADFDRLVAFLRARRLPSFSVMGRGEVERGLLVGLRPADDIPRIARRVALTIQQILLGEPAEKQPTAFDTREQLVINMATARAIGAWPSWRVLTEAELLHTMHSETDRRLTLTGTVREALNVSADLAVADADVDAGRYDIPRARARLLPSLDAGAQGLMIDEDRAAASLGSQPQYTGTVKASVTQLLWADRAWADVTAQEHLQSARESARLAVRLDVALEAAVAYLSVLQATTFERIQRDNLKVTRANLDAARIRERIGSGTASEVHRWEAQIATDTQAVIDASTRRRLAHITVNRILRHPLEEAFVAEEARLDDPEMVSSQGIVFRLLDNPHTFSLFRGFMVEEGLRNAPELAQLDAAIAAATRRGVAAERALWSPDIALSGEASYRFYEGGEGTEGLQIDVPMGVQSPDIPESDALNWFVGLSATLPLYAGGARYAEIRQADAEVTKLKRQRRALAEAIEQRVRSAVHTSGSSFPNIRLSGEAADAARKNFGLVRDAYARGATNITVLLDAQNASRTADQLAANAVYRFQTDLMQVHRAVGAFYFLMTPGERAQWTQRFVTHMERHGATEAK